MGRRLHLIGLMVMIGTLSVGCSQQKETPATPVPETTSETTSEAAEVSATPEATDEAETQTTEDEKSLDAIPVVKGEGAPVTNNTTGKGAAITPATTGKELVDAAFTSADPYYDFKVSFTQDFLDKVDKMYGVLDDRYKPEYDDECEFYVKEDRSQLEFHRDITEYEERYKYIYDIKNYVGFEDAKDDLYAWQKLTLNLCDEDKDGKIELNDASKTILSTFYPDINFEEVQNKINQAIANEKTQSYESLVIDTGEKYYGRIRFSWFRYKDNPVQVEINLDWYQNYPEK